MADPLKDRIAKLQVLESRGVIKPEHAAELANYRSQGLAPPVSGAPKIDKTAEASVEKSRVGAQAASESLSQLNELDDLNSRIRPTGGFVNNLVNSVEYHLGNSDLARMDELQTKIGRGSRIAGEGTMSDKDAEAFQRMTAGYDKPSEANKAYVAAGRKVFQNRIDLQAFREDWLAKHGNNLGADAAFLRQKNIRPTAKSAAGEYSFDEQ